MYSYVYALLILPICTNFFLFINKSTLANCDRWHCTLKAQILFLMLYNFSSFVEVVGRKQKMDLMYHEINKATSIYNKNVSIFGEKDELCLYYVR